MEEKILKELREIKELLHDIKENMEQKEIKISLEDIQNEMLETSSKLISISNKVTRL